VVTVLDRDVTAGGAVMVGMLGLGEMITSRHVKPSVERPPSAKRVQHAAPIAVKNLSTPHSLGSRPVERAPPREPE
jgi:hypothetical protein